MKWKTLQHNGILFPPAFETQGIKLKIKGENVPLSLDQEEMVYQWAKKKDTPYAQDKVFQKNFTLDFAKTLDSKFKKISYEDIDFSDAYKLVDKEKDLKEMMTKEEKKDLAAKRKELREQLKEKYGKAIMDGGEVEVGNYMAEPPGIFIGRGEHPLRGRWKPRVTAKDVTLNLGKEAKAPEGNWGKIVHDKDSMWLASWLDYLTQKRKYVWLADTAGLKQDRDKEKYEKAVKLAKEIEKIKDRIVKDMKSKDPKIVKISTACYLIYRTAMRVGDEKDPDEADTVGATTLRKEHINLTSDAIKFDFLGKDSVRWQETVPAQGHDKQFHENLKKIIQNKKPKDDIFDGITSRHVNAYYSSIVKGLTAKVFRTYLATNVVKNYLKEHDNLKGKTPNEKLYHAKLANLEAAVMCNHKRTIPKTFEQTLQKKRDTLKTVEKDKPWKKTEETLKKVEAKETKTDAQKKAKQKRIKTLNDQMKKQKLKHKERQEKLKLQIDLSEKTRDYNLGTSLRNYIDPRVVKAWTDEVGAEWEKLYTAALQKKFLWVKNDNTQWKEIKG
ncbi:MAG: DNA topoisomerase I [Nitrosopumilaceae archaeon]|jgi:DNA topoisomerase-1|uniref:DNA topoisomerase I n=3 Tax=Candidatus Nitrosomaritimum aestuariumsis TaxID=3342354 RepID=A0AC60VWL3_9ARCH|nr:DNA topoisomerase I [Nitrosopumilaceae archaeon]MBA4460940.1 DNA topoisomerase I [Nitrosopumilaceae archaeon]MBA4464153.1 DNA topoisomerase I [Nitrosopumilaceae archaeon]